MNQNHMASSEQSLPENALSTHLQRFKGACAEQCKLKTQILELMQKMETAAVSTVRYAESELEKVRNRAVDVRAEMEETRLAYGISTTKSSEKSYLDSSSISHPLDHPIAQPLLPEGGLVASCPAEEVPESPLSSSFGCITPLLSSGPDGSLLLESPHYPPSDLKPHSDVSDEITNTHGEDEVCHDEAIRMMAQRYIKVSEARQSLEVEIERELETEESVATERIVSARQSLKDMRERATEIAGILNQANIFKLPSLENIAVEGKEIPSEMVAAVLSPVPIVVAELAGTDNPAGKGDDPADPSSFLAPQKPVESFPEALVESFRKYDQSLVNFFSDPSPNTIPAPSLFIKIGLHSGVGLTPADDSRTFSPKLVEPFVENYWKWKGGNPVCGREIMKTHWFLMRSLILPRNRNSAYGRSYIKRVQAMIDSL